MSFAASVAIAAAALVASAPSAGQSPPNSQTHWLSDEQTGCRAPDPDYADGDGIVWSGACANGMVSGQGSLTFLNNGQPQVTITGNFRDGNLESGRASLAWPDGSKYDGEQVGGKFEGQGVFVSAQHDRLDGQWKAGALSGHAVVAWANGNRYEGEWANGKAEGHGVETWANGDRYDGHWQDGKAQGRGVQTWANGQNYDGEWRDDRPNGLGKLVRTDKSIYEGKFVDGHPDGDMKTADASLPVAPVAAKAAPTSAPTAAALPASSPVASDAAATPSPSTAIAAAATTTDDSPPQHAGRLGEVEGRRLVAVDGSSIAFAQSEGGFTRAITKADGGKATTTFTFVNDRMGTVADASNPDLVTGLFKTSDAEIDVDYADGHSEVLKPGAGGVTLALRSPDGSNYCMAWYPEGHVFSVSERKAALAAYASRLGVPLKGADAKAIQHTTACSITGPALAARPATVVAPATVVTPGLPRPRPRPIKASFETVSPPTQTEHGLQAIDVRTSQVHLIDTPRPDNDTAPGGQSAGLSSTKSTALASLPAASMSAVPEPAASTASAPAPVSPQSADRGASSCLSVASDGAHWGFRNSCGYSVQFAYCLKGDIEPLAACKEGAISGSAAPDSFSALVADASVREKNVDHQFRWVACGGGAGEVVPKLDGTDPPVGRCVRAVTPDK